ncbi:MAG TPA: hypothetical protein VIJ27_07870 [Mucilaginibacter sp.]
MSGTTHELYDKRLKKPVIYRVADLNEDITMKEIVTMKVGKCELRFDKPNFTSIFLGKSEKELLKAKEIYKALINPKLTVRERFVLSKENTRVLFDYLEHVQSAIIMAFTAVECVANDLLPDDFVYEEKRKGEENRKYDRKDIERWISTTDKLALVIPQALKITSPKTYNFWPKFTKLKDLRNDIIHFRNLLPIEQEEKERIISLLLSDSVFGKISSAFDLIKKIQSDLPPHAKMPILKNTETIDPIEIPTWDSLEVTRID